MDTEIDSRYGKSYNPPVKVYLKSITTKTPFENSCSTPGIDFDEIKNNLIYLYVLELELVQFLTTRNV